MKHWLPSRLRRTHFGPRGFSLMEVLVGMMVLGIAFSTLFGLISGSMRNIDRLREHEKVVRYGQMKLNQLVLQMNQGSSPLLSGVFDAKYRWQASAEPLNLLENPVGTPGYSLVRLRLAVQWTGQAGANEYKLETVTWLPVVSES